MSKESEILDKLHYLPVLPAVLQEVIASFSNRDINVDELAHKIAQDPGLSTKILRMANSPFYGLTRKVGSVHDAVVVLGFNSLRSLSLASGLACIHQPNSRHQLDYHTFLGRSFCVANYAEVLAQCLGSERHTAFTAGMLYDIGQVVLDICMPEQFSAVLVQQRISGQDLIEIERSVLGVDHVLIGAEMMRRWNFPEAVELAVRDWRAPGGGAGGFLASIVHIAVLLEGGLRGEELVGRLPGALRSRLEMNWERIESCLPERSQLDGAIKLLLEP
ncbi:MAG: HDOD domain-containing protein [Gallionellaceae bacterium]|nr:HDOD domain-containing protein [Gallionellaceae bacterium]